MLQFGKGVEPLVVEPWWRKGIPGGEVGTGVL